MTQTPNNDVVVLLPTKDIWPYITDMHISFCSATGSIGDRIRFHKSDKVHQMKKLDYSHWHWLLHLDHELNPGISLANSVNVKYSPNGLVYCEVVPFLPYFSIRSLRTKTDVIITDPYSIINFLTSN